MKILLAVSRVEENEIFEIAKAKGIQLFPYERDKDSWDFIRVVNPAGMRHWNFYALLREDIGPVHQGSFDEFEMFEFDINDYRGDAQLIEYIEENMESFDSLKVVNVQEDRVFIIQKDENMYYERITYLDEVNLYKCTSEGLVLSGEEMVVC